MFTWRISEICWRSLILRNPQLEDGGQWEKNCMSHLSGQFLLISNLQHNTGHQSVFDSPPYMLQGPITAIFPTPESNCPKDIFRCFCRKSPQRCQSPKVKGSNLFDQRAERCPLPMILDGQLSSVSACFPLPSLECTNPLYLYF